MQHVQNSEERLENKRKHCTICQPIFEEEYRGTDLTPIDTDVVKAFESALALLNGRARP